MRTLLRRLDDGLYRVEKAVCVGLLAAMAVVVFFDAIHRQLATEGRLPQLLSTFLPGASARLASAALVAAVGWVVIYGALRTAKVEKKPRQALAAGLALLGVALCWGFSKLLLLIFPNGLIWAQSFGLSGMLWVGFLGASMATKEGSHLTLEIMEFVWRGRLKAHVGRAGALLAAAFCLVLGWLSLEQVKIEYGEWAGSEGAVGTLSGFEAPRFLVFAILPWSLAVMALRFLGRAVGPTQQEAPPSITPLAAGAKEEGR